MINMKSFKLNDGNEIPSVGFGTFMIPADGSTYKAVSKALEFGIRHIDTAVAYFNEQEVGQAVKDSEVDREDVWINQNYGFKTTNMRMRKKPLTCHWKSFRQTIWTFT